MDNKISTINGVIKKDSKLTKAGFQSILLYNDLTQRTADFVTTTENLVANVKKVSTIIDGFISYHIESESNIKIVCKDANTDEKKLEVLKNIRKYNIVNKLMIPPVKEALRVVELKLKDPVKKTFLEGVQRVFLFKESKSFHAKNDLQKLHSDLTTELENLEENSKILSWKNLDECYNYMGRIHEIFGTKDKMVPTGGRKSRKSRKSKKSRKSRKSRKHAVK